jgi:hypothetical protein
MMLAIFLIDHRLALLALAALIVGAAIPLAFAWARILPEEPPPFDTAPSSDAKPGAARKELARPKNDSVAMVLLVCVTLSYAMQFPGVPRQIALRWLESRIPEVPSMWVFWGVVSIVAVLNAGVAGHAIFRPSSLRVPLGVGAALVFVLWLLAHFLRVALVAPSVVAGL